MPKHLYRFGEAINWLEENSNHANDGIFKNIYSEETIDRHKGYLNFNGQQDANSTIWCFDTKGEVSSYFNEYVWELVVKSNIEGETK